LLLLWINQRVFTLHIEDTWQINSERLLTLRGHLCFLKLKREAIN